jgi:ABC-type polysaccharide/polyol phosphate export permease
LRDIRVRYKAPWLGAVWAFVVPLVVSLVLMLVFGHLLPVAPEPSKFFLFVATAMFPWNFFQASVSSSTTSIQENAELIQKVAFPRAILPLAIVGANGFSFLCALLVLSVMVWWMSGATWWVLLLPCAILLQGLFTVGVAWIVAGLQASYRDVKYVVEVGLWLWFYLTPVFYPMTWVHQLGGMWAALYLANPMVSLISLFRVALLGPETAELLTSSAVMGCLATAIVGTSAVLVVGWWVFQRHEPALADLVQ